VGATASEEVTLVKAGPNTDDRDRYDRLLRYVESAGVDAGYEQIAAGMAIAGTIRVTGMGRTTGRRSTSSLTRRPVRGTPARRLSLSRYPNRSLRPSRGTSLARTSTAPTSACGSASPALTTTAWTLTVMGGAVTRMGDTARGWWIG
jgi:hypothetical protein